MSLFSLVSRLWGGGSPLSLLQTSPGFWMPARGSSEAGSVDRVFDFILVIAVIFFALVITLMVTFVVRYRRRPDTEAKRTVTHNTPLELTWTLIPLGLVVLIFLYGFRTYMDMNVPPQNSMEILVTGQKWNWQFTYPNGFVDGTLHVPVNKPVRLTLTSEDVIHSFFVPDFRIKKDAVPGRYTKLWFTATAPGEHQVFCAEYCGTGHSDMLTKVVVHEPGGYETWLAQASNFVDKLPPSEAGARLVKSRGCLSCHSMDGAPGIGPTLKGIFGHPVVLKDGSKTTIDEDYVRESILDPQAKVVAGFDPVMPTFKGRIKDKEITAIIEYLKTLQ